METFDFGEAIHRLKSGKKVARSGWNGRGMWLILVPGSRVVPRVGTPYHTALSSERQDPAAIEILPHIDMWTTNAEGRRAMLCGWLASQTDMLSSDWTEVE